jgi:hypothetical protein
MKKLNLLIAVATLAFSGAASAQTTLNFQLLPTGSFNESTYASDGLTVVTRDADANVGTPFAGGAGYGLVNSLTGPYPTTEQLDFLFSMPATVDSFTYNSFGGTDPNLYWTAYNSSLQEIGGGTVAGNLSTGNNGFVAISPDLANVAYLVFDNGITTESTSSTSTTTNFEFGVGSLTIASVPEPSSWALGLIALGGVVYLRRRSRRA